MDRTKAPSAPSSASAVDAARRDLDERLRRFAGSAIGLNRTFAGLHSLLFRTRLLALNAEIASARIGATGAAFGVVVKDLLSMGEELRRLTREIEDLFGRVARHVGVWIRARTRFNLYLRVIDALHRGVANADGETKTPPPVQGWPVLDDTIQTEAGLQAEARAARPALDRTWTLALANRGDALANLREVRDYCRRLDALLDQLNFVATRQSGFLATTARVEATHADQTAFDLTGVTGDIRDLAQEFTVLQHTATDAVVALSGEAESIFILANTIRRSARR